MKPAASISLDLDNLWSYLKTQGVPAGRVFRAIWMWSCRAFLETLDRCNQRITFFIVGKDATIESNRAALKQIADAGHEDRESLASCTSPGCISTAASNCTRKSAALKTPSPPSPARKHAVFAARVLAPSPLVREVLVERGYQYDASIFPSALGPVARMFFFLNSKLSAEEKAKRKGLYGKFSDAFGTLQPFTWPNGLIEIPVTTMPLFRVPVHATYLMFLAQKSEALAKAYWGTAIALSRLRGVAPSLLLHPTDFLDVSDVPQMSFFPGMKVPRPKNAPSSSTPSAALQQHWQTGSMSRRRIRSMPAPHPFPPSPLKPPNPKTKHPNAMKTPTQVNEIAIVLPAYNEEKDLPVLLENIRSKMADMPFKYTVVVVDDGSKDRTAEIAREGRQNDAAQARAACGEQRPR
jgi:hypothetical protein